MSMCVISPYESMSFILYCIFCSTYLLTIESLEDEEIKALVQQAGETFSYPEPFQMANTEPPTISVGQISYDRTKIDGFHLADILGYIVTSNIQECMAACHAYSSCKALNYIESNGWCVLTQTACKHQAEIWNNPDVGSVHVYFITGPNKSSVESANLQILNVTDTDTSGPCLYSKDREVEKVNVGSALLCPENVGGNRSAWTLYGIKIQNHNCPGKFVFPMFNIHYLMSYLESGAKLIAKPTENDIIDLSAEIILQNGNDYSFPFPYKILPIDHDLVLEHMDIKPNHYSESNGFHFADVINYTKVDSKEDCMVACIVAVEPCWAVNYVENNKWCVFLASAHKNRDNRYVELWKSKNLSSWHIYFYRGRKTYCMTLVKKVIAEITASSIIKIGTLDVCEILPSTVQQGKDELIQGNPPRHEPLKRGVGIKLPTGLAPRMKMKGARISGGTHSAPLTHPWMAKINRNCGGALIENPIDNVNKKIRSDLILTAAHCVNMESNDGPEGFSPSRVRIRLGVHRDDILEIAQEFHKANKIVSHRDFDYQTKHNDIALIQLEKLVDFSNFIGPISLPPEDAPVPVSQPCKAMGWGRVDIDQDGSKVLKEVKLQVTNSCRSMDTAAMIKGNVFCTEPVENAEDNICIGDSGGPFLCSKVLHDGSSLSTIFGITSFGSGHSCTDGYAGFANVSSLIGWLKGAVSKLENQLNDTHEYFP